MPPKASANQIRTPAAKATNSKGIGLAGAR